MHLMQFLPTHMTAEASNCRSSVLEPPVMHQSLNNRKILQGPYFNLSLFSLQKCTILPCSLPGLALEFPLRVASLLSLLKSSFFLHWTSPAQLLSWSLRSTHLSERSGKDQQRLVVLRTLWVPVLVLSPGWLRRKQNVHFNGQQRV